MPERSAKSGLSDERRYLQLEDVARELVLAKSTVSRAISGKGRIGKETRDRVLQYIEQHEYRPNMIAKGLAKSQTFNIGVVLPSDSFLSEIPFFQNALMGVCEIAQACDYDVIVTSVRENEIASLRRMIVNKKVDGVVLTRSVLRDPCVAYLKETGVPFVLIGSSEDAQVCQVDTDHAAACRALTVKALSRGCARPALLYGNPKHIVNQSRLRGFLEGLAEAGLPEARCRIIDGLGGRREIEAAVDACLAQGCDGLICGDDYICSRVLARLPELGPRAPEALLVASFYNSVLLEGSRQRVLAVDINARSLGMTAAAELFSALTPNWPREGITELCGADLHGAYTIKG